MRNTWTNPNPKLNISLLNNQYFIFIKVMFRMISEQRNTEANELMNELKILRKIITKNESE